MRVERANRAVRYERATRESSTHRSPRREVPAPHVVGGRGTHMRQPDEANNEAAIQSARRKRIEESRAAEGLPVKSRRECGGE